MRQSGAGLLGERVRDGQTSGRDEEGLELGRVVFFFQAEDGIRDIGVTGVQTCALPIWAPSDNPFRRRSGARPEIYAYGLRNPYRFSFDRSNGSLAIGDVGQDAVEEISFRSEERRVGKECRSRWSPYHYKKNTTPPPPPP